MLISWFSGMQKILQISTTIRRSHPRLYEDDLSIWPLNWQVTWPLHIMLSQTIFWGTDKPIIASQQIVCLLTHKDILTCAMLKSKSNVKMSLYFLHIYWYFNGLILYKSMHMLELFTKKAVQNFNTFIFVFLIT